MHKHIQHKYMNSDTKQIIVSLTSFPEAIPYAIQSIKSVLNGVVLPDKIMLYLTASQFPDKTNPLIVTGKQIGRAHV